MRPLFLSLVLLAACGGSDDSAAPDNCIVHYDGCNGGNACEPLCVAASEAEPCDISCQAPQEPEGDCVFFGGECTFR